MSTPELDLLKKYPKAIIHLRQRLYGTRDAGDEFDLGNKLGLVFGAGTGLDLGFPDWKTLVKRISEHSDVDNANLYNEDSPTLAAQLLYQYFVNKQLENYDGEEGCNYANMTIHARWQSVVHACLYLNVSPDVKERTQNDKYLLPLIDLVKLVPLTVTYNFDDSIELLLEAARDPKQRERERGYATIWGADAQTLPRKAVIYHTNGFLPTDLKDRPSEDLVFLEDSFADQLIDSMAGRYTMLLDYMTQNTCLLVGLSLADETLKHHLRQVSQRRPGHCHYYVKWCCDKETPDESHRKLLSDYYFETYGLVTLFLTSDEVAALCGLLLMPRKEFGFELDKIDERPVYRYYLTGSVAVGKTTAVAQFRNLQTHDEWLERRHADMEKAPKLTETEVQDKIDEWVDRQVALKDRALRSDAFGLHIVDRAPLDAFAFKDGSDWKARATAMKKKVSELGKSGLVSAQIILLIGEPSVLAARAAKLHKKTSADDLRLQQDKLIRTYTSWGEGCYVIDTINKSKAEVAREIARYVYFGPYQEAPLNEWLTGLESGKVVWDND